MKRSRGQDSDSEPASNVHQLILDSITSPVALLEPDGCIAEINAAWKAFHCEDSLAGKRFQPGTNYPETCEATGLEPAADLAGGIREVLDGRTDPFSLEYSCTGLGDERWFEAKVTPTAGCAGAVVIHVDVTRQVQAEQALRSSERRLRRVFEDAASGIVTLDPDGVFLQGNAAFLDRLGRSEDELKGVNLTALCHPRELEETEARIDELLAGTKSPVVIEQRLKTAADDWVWIRIRLSVQRDKQGKPMRLIAITEDITERKEMERRLERSQTLLRIGGRIGRVGGWAADLEQDRVSWSQEIFEVLEWPEESPPPFSESLDLCVPGDRERLEQALQQCARDGTPFDLEIRLRTAGGREIWARIGGEPEPGRPGRVVGVFQDITAHKRTEAQRNDFADRLQRTLDNMSEGFYLLDVRSRFVYLNPEAERILQRRAEDLVGKEVWEEFPETRDSPVFEAFNRAMRTGRSENLEFHYPALGEWLQAHVYPSGEGLAVYFRTTTEERQLKEQLHQSQRLEAVGQLTGGVAHDFNNLLTVIQGNAEMLIEQAEGDPRLVPMAEMIIGAAQRGTALTQHLLAFARRQPLEPRSVAVGALITDMRRLLKATVGERIELALDSADGIWPALVDPGQLESALLNLCLNARDAMDGEGRITLFVANVTVTPERTRHAPEFDPGDYVQISVSDTGSGIPQDILDRVFDPFFTTKPTGKGTGLGLSMVYGFVKQSGGHVQIDSEEEVGTTVTMYLPRERGTAPVHSAGAVADVQSGGSETILLVEDDEMVRRYARDQLVRLGYQVLEAERGAPALDLLRERGDEVDLLFTDVIMPGGMSGRELADEALKIRPDLKVLFTSGYTEDQMVHDGRLDPGIQLLAKPYRRAELATRIRRVLEEEES